MYGIAVLAISTQHPACRVHVQFHHALNTKREHRQTRVLLAYDDSSNWGRRLTYDEQTHSNTWGKMKIKILGAVALLPILLAGCGGTASAPAPTVAPATASQTASPTASAVSAVEAKSPRGNIVKKAGEGAAVTDKGKTVASFVINSIQVDPGCTGEYASKSENGHFVVLDVSMETMPELAESASPQFGLAGYAWKAIAENGTTFNGSVFTGAAYMCLNDTETFPSALGPAEKATGKIVLDVPTPAGVLVHQQGFMPTGWEWAYPAK